MLDIEKIKDFFSKVSNWLSIIGVVVSTISLLYACEINKQTTQIMDDMQNISTETNSLTNEILIAMNQNNRDILHDFITLVREKETLIDQKTQEIYKLENGSNDNSQLIASLNKQISDLAKDKEYYEDRFHEHESLVNASLREYYSKTDSNFYNSLVTDIEQLIVTNKKGNHDLVELYLNQIVPLYGIDMMYHYSALRSIRPVFQNKREQLDYISEILMNLSNYQKIALEIYVRADDLKYRLFTKLVLDRQDLYCHNYNTIFMFKYNSVSIFNLGNIGKEPEVDYFKKKVETELKISNFSNIRDMQALKIKEIDEEYLIIKDLIDFHIETLDKENA